MRLKIIDNFVPRLTELLAILTNGLVAGLPGSPSVGCWIGTAGGGG
jgi:hypothetical protein